MQFNLPGGVLQSFANAGAGETTVPGLMAGLDTTAIFDQCQGVMPWRTDLTASGHPTVRGPTATVGTYGTTGGPTTPYQPDASNQALLVTQLSQALAGVKSCAFDLNSVEPGKTIKVDLNQLSKASVLIEGNAVPLDPRTRTAGTWRPRPRLCCTAARATPGAPERPEHRLQLPLQIIVD